MGVGEFDLRLGRVMENLNWSGLVEYTCLFIFVICFRAKLRRKKEFRLCERMIHPARGTSHVFEVVLEVCTK